MTRKKCLSLAAQGKSIKQSAKILGLSINSIKYYRKSIIKKLGCKNIIEAILVGLRYDFIRQSKKI
ncbi:helix-turn-helix transcriptional regulator [Rickettsiella massiliensis]|uniref:helix-turn-helix transcriptional regulator n=1 Tax=Rickettsiella massiliensis TaxID=676517 RepID=UPI0009FC37DD